MTTNEQNGHLVANRIEVEPTDRQRAAHELVEAFGIAGEIDWTAVEANFRVLTETAGYESPLIGTGRAAAARVNSSLLAGTGTLAGRPRCRTLSPWTKRAQC